jgi:hypothetical protein
VVDRHEVAETLRQPFGEDCEFGGGHGSFPLSGVPELLSLQTYCD